MDPLRMAEAGRLIAEALAELDDSVDWMARAEAYATELEEVDVEIQQILAGIPEESRVLVTNHDSLGYFAARYGFDVVGTVLPGGSTLGDPSSDQLANLVQLMRELDVRVIFAETTEPSSLAEAVSQEVGDSVQVVELYSGSLGEPGSGAETLTEMLLVNARLIAESMQ
ncbi:MAG: zinc ABC transporter substrate-binding protein [Actinobacteria bacterium]|nr:MAG: zinc ABC transporter substrate-binding protein [Actinomycetota bacterium]